MSDLIEREIANCVEKMMNRANTILVSLLPALMLVGSMNCFGETIRPAAIDRFHTSVLSGNKGNHKGTACNNADQAVRRCGRRANLQPGPDGFPSVAIGAVSHTIISDPTLGSPEFPCCPLGLAQSWQFLWRTALEARAPALAS